MGFGRRGKNSFTVHRSEEVLPGEVRGGLSRGSSASSDGEGSADGDRFAHLQNSLLLSLEFSIFFFRFIFSNFILSFHFPYQHRSVCSVLYILFRKYTTIVRCTLEN